MRHDDGCNLDFAAEVEAERLGLRLRELRSAVLDRALPALAGGDDAACRVALRRIALEAAWGDPAMSERVMAVLMGEVAA